MITISHEQLEKINLLDKLFGSLGVDQLREFVESEQVVARLKGSEENPQLLLEIVHEHDIMMLDLMNAKAEIVTLKSDFQALLRALHADVFTPRFNQDFQNLKSKHSVY